LGEYPLQSEENLVRFGGKGLKLLMKKVVGEEIDARLRVREKEDSEEAEAE